jgi:hypothetical protein
MDSFREFAAQLDQALDQDNTTFLLNRVLNTQLTCAGDEQVGPCLGEKEGTVKEGVYSGIWRTDTVDIVEPKKLAESYNSLVKSAQPEEKDDYGTGEPRLYALATAPSGPIGGRDTYYAIVTAITGDAESSQRKVLLYTWVSWNSRWQTFGEVDAGTLTAEWLSGDCPDCYLDWELWKTPTS